jgi:hypothetical protein
VEKRPGLPFFMEERVPVETCVQEHPYFVIELTFFQKKFGALEDICSVADCVLAINPVAHKFLACFYSMISSVKVTIHGYIYL